MKLFLFGGAELDIPEVSPAVLKQQIKEVLLNIEKENILHIPFARLRPFEEEWKEGWFKELMKDTGKNILDARVDKEIDMAGDSVIFINGGVERKELINNIRSRPKLLTLIYGAEYIVAESAGSMAMGESMTADRSGNEIIEGLGILKSTIIEVHYAERRRQQLLLEDLKKTGVKYGIGIDCATALVTDPEQFPKNWKKIGIGNVYIENNFNK